MKKLIYFLLLFISFASEAQVSVYKSADYTGNDTAGYVPVTFRNGNYIYVRRKKLSTFSGGGSISPGGLDSYVQFNDGSALNGVSSFLYNKTNKTLRIVSNNALDIGDSTSNFPAQIIFRRYPNATINGSRGSVGFIGSTEMNIGLNLDYRDNSHKAFDSTANAIWLYMGSNGSGFQGVTKGHVNSNIYNTYGKNMWRVEWLQALNEYVGSRTHTNELYLWDRTTTDREQSSGYSAKFTVGSTNLSIAGVASISAPDSTDLALGSSSFLYGGRIKVINSGTKYGLYMQNVEANTNGNFLRFIKKNGSSFSLTNGTKIFDIDMNSIANFGAYTQVTPGDGFSQPSMYFNSRTSAGGTARDVWILDPDGNNYSLGNVSAGVASALAKFHVQSTTVQQRWSYDASNYMTATVGSTGNVTWDLVGTGPQHAFSQLLNLNNGFRTNSTSDNSNIAVPTAQGTVSSTAGAVIFGGASTVHYRALFRGSGSSSINNNTSYANVIIGGAPVTATSTGTHAWFVGTVAKTAAITTGAAAITNSATLLIDDVATQATNNYSLYVRAGLSRFVGMASAITTVSANTTLDLTHYTVLVDASGGARTITLPTGTQYTGVIYVIKKIDSSGNAVGFTTAEGAQSLATQWGLKKIQYNGTNWYIIGN